jgi:hypothetical protein
MRIENLLRTALLIFFCDQNKRHPSVSRVETPYTSVNPHEALTRFWAGELKAGRLDDLSCLEG